MRTTTSSLSCGSVPGRRPSTLSEVTRSLMRATRERTRTLRSKCGSLSPLSARAMMAARDSGAPSKSLPARAAFQMSARRLPRCESSAAIVERHLWSEAVGAPARKGCVVGRRTGKGDDADRSRPAQRFPRLRARVGDDGAGDPLGHVGGVRHHLPFHVETCQVVDAVLRQLQPVPAKTTGASTDSASGARRTKATSCPSVSASSLPSRMSVTDDLRLVDRCARGTSPAERSRWSRRA